jgi:hypothetical protein
MSSLSTSLTEGVSLQSWNVIENIKIKIIEIQHTAPVTKSLTFEYYENSS